MRETIRRFCMKLFRCPRGQALLARVVSQLDLWRGYGAGAFVASSGEEVLFRLVRSSAFTRPGPPEGGTPNEIVVLDVGANVGEFSAAALENLGGGVRIHAFEPQGKIFRQLSTRFAGNERVTANNLALGRAPGEMPIYGTSRDSGMASLVNRNLAHLGLSAALQETVKVERLADYCEARGVKRIDLLKMDVEGFELEVLAGAEKLFAAGGVALCSFEFGGCNLDSRTFLKDFYDFFAKHRMKIHRITPAGTLVELGRYSENLERFTNTNYVAIHEQSL